jgi:hypothetical protein
MIMVRVVRMIVGVRIIGMIVTGLVGIMRVAMRPKSGAVIVKDLARVDMGFGHTGLALLKQDFGLTASAYAAHHASSDPKTIPFSPRPIRAKAATAGGETRLVSEPTIYRQAAAFH